MLPVHIVIMHLIPFRFCGRNKFELSFDHIKDPQFLSAGAVGQVFPINRCIAVKIPMAEGYEEFSHENTILDELDRQPRCADIA